MTMYPTRRSCIQRRFSSTLSDCHVPQPSCYVLHPTQLPSAQTQLLCTPTRLLCTPTRLLCPPPPHPAWCLPAVGEHEEENAKADVADVTEDVVECVERPEGVRTQEVVVTDVLVTRHVQHLPTHKVNRVARSRNTRR